MIFIIYSLFVLALLTSINKKSYIIFKTLNSLAFIGVALYCAIISQHTSLLVILLPALIGCGLGDFVLATHYKKSFLYGLGCFLVANICYVFYFMHFKTISLIELIFPFLSIVIVISLSYLKHMDYGKYQTPILLYAFMITLATLRSISVYLLLSTPMFLYCMIGFILYFISDIILLFERFYQCPYQPYLKILNLITYYYGIFMIAYSLLF